MSEDSIRKSGTGVSPKAGAVPPLYQGVNLQRNPKHIWKIPVYVTGGNPGKAQRSDDLEPGELPD